MNFKSHSKLSTMVSVDRAIQLPVVGSQ